MKPTFIDRTIMKPFVAITPKWLSPNAITIFRLICVPIVIGLFMAEQYKIGALVFLIAAFSDALDGAIARTRDEITELGEFLDPMADKLLIISAAFFLLIKLLPVWIFSAVFILELITATLALFYKFIKHERRPANLFGKIKMFLQSVALLLLLLSITFWPMPVLVDIAFYLLFASIVFGVGSLLFSKGKL